MCPNHVPKYFGFTGSTEVYEKVTLDDDVTQKVAKFSDLGNVLSSGGVQEVVTARIRFGSTEYRATKKEDERKLQTNENDTYDTG